MSVLFNLFRSFTSSPPSPVSILRHSFSSSITAAASSSRPSLYQQRIMAAKDLVDSAVSQNKIVVFSKSYCPYCKRAKALLSSKFPSVPTAVYELDEREDGSDIQSYLLEKTGQRTVPNIFISQQHVGGSDALAALDSEGKLADLVGA
ncbi:hypothetical protein CERSUDRAFT_90784 [Gelatoporia subvermispora B]|uniref:Glutaredoxin domain-containing protein n=1 Tax=Ceriporiopsis subvermispora (strain B) TaxID=914234 RepID=M2RCK3_CERS8|nr:hypothetical protein CERSUDRAFT_90784 [Gelatoporia subvermispora B]